MNNKKSILILIALFTITFQLANAQNSHKKKNGKSTTEQSAVSTKNNRNNKIEPHGIYVTGDWQKPIPEFVLKSPDVDGVFLRLTWATYEPQPEKYDWSYIDSELTRIQAAGKKASFGIAAGSKSPDWIYTTGGVKGLTFSEIPHEGKGKKMNTSTVPVVWDANFLSIWTKFVTALATHLKSQPKLYECITQVKITGINFHTIEMRLPAQREITNGRDTSTNAYEIWKTVGYKPQLVKDAWHTIGDCFATNFPDKILNLAIIPNNGFPYFDDRGNEIPKSKEADLTRWLVEDGLSRYEKRFAVQFNALGATTGRSKIIADVASRGYIAGYQLEEVDFGKPKCLDNKSDCNENEFQSVLNSAMEDGAQFVEIFVQDVPAFPKSINYGSKKMNPQKKED